MLNNKLFKEVVRNTNLFAFDLIIKNQDGKILLAKRKNKPAKDMYFVPGGRVFKNETLNQAFERILKAETSINIRNIVNLYINGLYDHIYKDNIFEDDSFNTHYIVYAIEIEIDNKSIVHLDDQHDEYLFLTPSSLLSNNLVHNNVKNYFTSNPDNLFNLRKEIVK